MRRIRKSGKIWLYLWLVMMVFLVGSCQSTANIGDDPTNAENLRSVELDNESEAKKDFSVGGGDVFDPSVQVPEMDLAAVELETPQDSAVEPVAVEETDTELSCTLSVSAAVLLEQLDSLPDEKRNLVPADGIIFSASQIEFEEGDSVFTVLQREMVRERIHFEFSRTPAYDATYIEGINNLYEFDSGPLSGWTYRVNGQFPGYACSRYILADDDIIEVLYTCDLGRDVGAPQAVVENGP